MRLIDADHLKSVGREYCKTCIINGSKHCKKDCITNDVCDLLDSAPTVTIKEWINEMPLYIKEAMLEALTKDLTKRPHGKWLKYNSYYHTCNKCDKTFGFDGLEPNIEFYFCPNCGADMREGENNGTK